jgi:hypothetical protein
MVSASTTKIPHSLELVIDFVNTLDPDEPDDAFATTEGLGSWLVNRGLLDAADLPLREVDRREAVRLRKALLALMLAHNGVGTDESASLTPRAEGFAGALAEVVVPVAEGARDGSWERVKACRADDCEWAFYDRSRNHSGVWCDMAVCGNRAKVRAYRQRGAGSEAG